MTSNAKAPLPERVPFSATPPGEPPDIRRWAQVVVWTDRMLTTLLTNKVRGGKWHALIDKVYAEQKLQDGYVYVVDADLKGYFDHSS